MFPIEISVENVLWRSAQHCASKKVPDARRNTDRSRRSFQFDGFEFVLGPKLLIRDMSVKNGRVCRDIGHALKKWEPRLPLDMMQNAGAQYDIKWSAQRTQLPNVLVPKFNVANPENACREACAIDCKLSAIYTNYMLGPFLSEHDRVPTFAAAQVKDRLPGYRLT